MTLGTHVAGTTTGRMWSTAIRRASAKWKYFWQSVLGVGAALFSPSRQVRCRDPAHRALLKSVAYPLGSSLHHADLFVIVGTSNAVNLTDGLDGLAIMPTVMIASAFALFATSRHAVYAKYLLIPYVPGAGTVLLLGAIAGAGLASCGSTPIRRSLHGDVWRAGPGAALGTVAGSSARNRVADHGRVFVVETCRSCCGSWFKYTKKNTARADASCAWPAAPPLRTNGWKERGRRPLLDHHHHARAVGLSS